MVTARQAIEYLYRGSCDIFVKVYETDEITHISSSEEKKMCIRDRYYGGDHDIILRKRTTIDEDGDLREVKNLPNNRIVDNQYARMVNQKVNYSFAKPFSFDTKTVSYTHLDVYKRQVLLIKVLHNPYLSVALYHGARLILWISRGAFRSW